MSQSRNRRVSSHNREAGSGTRAVPADGSQPDFVTNARTLDSKSSNKIPKELRYDLENALVGLCDVWFDEIKPHLVKNNLKVHTGGALNENDYGDFGMAGDRSGANRGDRPRDLDPGAASDRRPSCDAFSPTRRVESSARCPRPPAPAPSRPTPLSPSEFHNLLKSISRHQKTAKTRRKTTRKEPQSPPLPQPSVTSAVRYPRCTACGFVSAQASKTPLRHQSDRTLPSWSHTVPQPLRPNNVLLSRPQYSSFQTTKPCTLNNRLPTIDSVDELSPQTEASKSPRTQLNVNIPIVNFTSSTTPHPQQFAKRLPFPNHTSQKSSSPYRGTGPSQSRPRTPKVSPPPSPGAKSPKNKRPVSPSTRSVVESGAVLAPWLRRTSENNWLLKPRDEIRRATRNPQTSYNNLRPTYSNINLFPVKHERKNEFEDKYSLFPEDLINLIGEKYDARINVLYQNPKGEDAYPSIMCLAGRKLSTTKTSWK